MRSANASRTASKRRSPNRSMQLATMPVSSAVLQLDLQDNPVYVFRNAGSGDVNLVYRRADGNIGWIDPGSIKQS
jgi:hypothetical protein